MSTADVRGQAAKGVEKSESRARAKTPARGATRLDFHIFIDFVTDEIISILTLGGDT